MLVIAGSDPQSPGHIDNAGGIANQVRNDKVGVRDDKKETGVPYDLMCCKMTKYPI